MAFAFRSKETLHDCMTDPIVLTLSHAPQILLDWQNRTWEACWQVM